MYEQTADELISDGQRSFEPLSLRKWARLYPALPLRTVALSLWEAHRTAALHPSEDDRGVIVIALATARLDEFTSRRGATR